MRLLHLSLLPTALAAVGSSLSDLLSLDKRADSDHDIITHILQATEATKKCSAAITALPYTPDKPAVCTDITKDCSPIISKVPDILSNIGTIVDNTTGEIRLVFRNELTAFGKAMEDLGAATAKYESEHPGFLEPCFCELLKLIGPDLEKQLLEVATQIAQNAGASASEIAQYAALLQGLLGETLKQIREEYCGTTPDPSVTPTPGSGNYSVTFPQPTGPTSPGGSTPTGPAKAAAAGFAPTSLGAVLAVAFALVSLG